MNTMDEKLYAEYRYPENGYRPAEGLEVGKRYEVENVLMGQSSTTIHLKNIRGNFNSVQFDFYEGNNPVDIYASPKYNPYIRSRRNFKEAEHD